MTIVWILLAQFMWLHMYTGEIVNVALKKPVSMSFRHTTDRYGPEMAVDGDTTATPPSIIHTDPHQSPTWWWVNLQTPVQDAAVKMYFRMDERRRRNGTQFYTSLMPFSSNSYPQGQLCHSIIGTNIEDVVSVNCSGTWQYLMVYTNTKNVPTDENPVLDFGEVQVLVCSSGMYGTNCTKSCSYRHCATRYTTCDRVSGFCPGGCIAGWRGTDCMEECSSGMYGANCTKSCSSRQCVTHSTTCDSVSGICPGGCTAGWRGTDCMEECPGGKYGINCNSFCISRHCVVNTSTCNRTTGECPLTDGCTPGWRGIDCSQACVDTYGRDCTMSCGDRKCKSSSSSCDHVTGQCVDGCKPGWNGTDCTHECPSKTYGEDCSKNCVSRHCLTSSDTCDHVTGACAPRGCEFGWYGTDCAQLCPLGTFGTNCSPCSTRHCKSMTECPDDGVCVGGCEDGWTLGNCTQACPSGTYGPDCSSTCGNCAGDTICHHSTGICTGACRAGWIGDQCKQIVGTGSEGMTPVTGGVIGGLVGVIVTLAVVGGLCVCLIRQGSLQWNVSKSKEPQQSAEMTESRVQQIQSNRPFAPSDIDEAHYSVLDGREMSDKTYYDVIDKKYQHTYQNT